ncbi:MAG: rhamnulokinase [Mariniblastus sp.]|jgi:rhamnulokinase
MSTAHLAIDLGASSGRAMIGLLSDAPVELKIEEVHRFKHFPSPTPAGPVWDLTGIWLNVLEGIKQGLVWCREHGTQLESIGVDTWGVDWALVGKSGQLIGLPHCYRDPQNVRAQKRVLELVGGKEALYQRTGIQLMAINSLFQVAARLEQEPQMFDVAHRLLFMPDLLHFWLSGEMTTERTIASTSGMLALETGDWDLELMDKIGIPTHVLGPLIDPGTVIGTLREEVARSVGASAEIKIIAPGAHDTASAIAAVPRVTDETTSGEWAYLSSGTWSLLGAELNHSFASAAACAAPFTNELGLSGTTRFLKNIAGLWLVQEVRRERVEQGEEVSFAEMAALAADVEPFRTLVDPNAAQFASPGNMADKIQAFAVVTGQPIPKTLGELVRCCLDSLGLCYRHTVDKLEYVLNIKIETLHIVGGGINNRLLNEITAAALQRPVICGPVEATAIGNVLTQAIGCGRLDGLEDVRAVVARSFEPETYLPAADGGISVSDEVFERYRMMADV